MGPTTKTKDFSVTVRMSRAEVDRLEKLREEFSLDNRSDALRWLINLLRPDSFYYVTNKKETGRDILATLHRQKQITNRK